MTTGIQTTDWAIETLLNSMTLSEKVGQLNQRLLGWKCLERRNGSLIATDYLKSEIDRWGGLGVLYGVLRADPWSGQSWANGIRPQDRAEATSVIQQTVVERGAHGVGTLISEEAPHGHQALGGTVLPVNLAMGATFDPELVEQAQAAIGEQLYESGVHLALVSGLDVARDPRWGRCEECYGEDPYLAALMCEATVHGMQGVERSKVGHGGVAVVMKHLAAQGEAVGGRNGQSAILGSRDLRQIHLPPVDAAVRAGALGFMAAYNDIDGVPCCANPWLLQTYLRDELGFDGIVMADGLAVDRLADMTGSIPAAGRSALLSGVDVSLWDEGFSTLAGMDFTPSNVEIDISRNDTESIHNPESINNEAVLQAIDRSVRRVLALKQRFDLLPDSGRAQAAAATQTQSERSYIRALVPGTARIEASLNRGERLSEQCAQHALVELHNTGALIWSQLGSGPLVVTGALADDADCFYGDYTAPLPATLRTTVYGELCDLVQDRDVVLVRDAESPENRRTLARAAVIVNVTGGTSEREYEETFAENGAAGDAAVSRATGGEGVDMASIMLPWQQDELLSEVVGISSAPIISVVVAGRAHVLKNTYKLSSRVIWAGYAGPYGPQAVAKAITEQASCTGRLPITLPSSSGVVPVRYNDRQSAQGVYKDVENPVLSSFGFSALSGYPKVGGLLCESAHKLRIVSKADEMNVTTRLNTELDDQLRLTFTFDAQQTDKRPMPYSMNLFIHRWGGSTVPRQRELVATMAVPTYISGYEQKLVSATLSYSRLFDREEGTTVELLDDAQAPYCVLQPMG